MKDERLGDPGIHQLRHPCPRHPILLAATPQRAPTAVGDMMPESPECRPAGRPFVVIDVAADNPSQPLLLIGDRLVLAPSQLLLDLLELRSHAVLSGFPL